MNYDEELEKLFYKKVLKFNDIKHLDYGFLSENILQKPRQIVWHLMNPEIKEPLRCIECNENYVSWMKNMEEYTADRGGYRKYCSAKCSANSEKVRKKYKDTCIEKYGVINSFQHEEVKNKIKKTNTEKYGTDNPQKNKEIHEKTTNTIIEKYGVDNISKSPLIQEKRKQKFIDFYGYDNPMKSDEIKQKTRSTMLEKYGVEYPLQNNEIREKAANTNLEKYGTTHPVKSDVVMDKIKQTNLKNYGYESNLSSPEIRNKIKQTNIKKYGYESNLSLPETREKIKETNLERYGTPFISQTHLSSNVIEIINSKEKFSNFIKDKTAYEISRELGIHTSSFYDIAIRYDVQGLYNKSGLSYLEIEMKEFLQSLKIDFQINNKRVLNGKELDFYIPTHNIAIEMNGDYWHSDYIRNKRYHYDKWAECKEKDIHLIQILETDWNNHKEKFKDMIYSQLSLKRNTKGARKFTISKIKNKLGIEFFKKYHLQGSSNSSKYYYGAYDEYGLLRAVMSFGWTRGKIENRRFELTRWATDNKNNYPGLFSKTFKYSVNDMNIDSVVSFSMNDWFTGNVYMKSGFYKNKILAPDYKYLYNGFWRHKSYFTKERIKKIFCDNENVINMINCGNTEKEIMKYLNIYKTWDSGKIEWIWEK